MSDEARAVLEAARKLPPEERILVAEALYDEAAEGEPESEEAFLAEMHRRADEVRRGVEPGIPWQDVLRGAP